MSPMFRWLFVALTAALLLVTVDAAQGQDAPYPLAPKTSLMADRIRQIERAQLEQELARSVSPQIALHSDVFAGAVSGSGEGDPFTPDNPRAAVYTFTMPANVSILLVEVMETEAPDLDLFVGLDANGNGLPEWEETICSSLLVSQLDWCALRRPAAGPFWVLTFSYRGSGAAFDDFQVDINGFGSEVRYSSSAALEEGKYARAGDVISFTAEVQPPMPRTAPLSYTITSILPDGLQRVVPIPPDPGRAAQTSSAEWQIVTSGAAARIVFEAVVEADVAVDANLTTELIYTAGEERHGRVTSDLYVMGVALQITATGTPTAPLGATAPFTVTVTNLGVLAAENLTATVVLPAGAEHVAGGVLQGGQVIWPIARLEAGASVDLPLSLRLLAAPAANQPAPAPAARIVGGEEAQPGAWPWQVALWDMEYDEWWGCGGSLIGPNWILTAAHCVTSGSFVVPASSIGAAIGRHHVNSNEGYVIGASAVLVHPLYDHFTAGYDVALLRLTAAAPLSGAVAYVPLATVADAPAYAPGAPAVTTGWGTREYGTWDFPSGLYQVEAPIYDDDACTDDYSMIYGEDVISDSMICAGVPEGGKDACQGDSGGPLVVRDGGNLWRQVGITSWGYRCAYPNAPGIYSRIPSFVDWIQREMRTVRLVNYSVTDGSGAPGRTASGAAAVETVFVETLSTVWVPIVASDSAPGR
jgi:uncharacterized repeat protein (TIGR01451 family)